MIMLITPEQRAQLLANGAEFDRNAAAAGKGLQGEDESSKSRT